MWISPVCTLFTQLISFPSLSLSFYSTSSVLLIHASSFVDFHTLFVPCPLHRLPLCNIKRTPTLFICKLLWDFFQIVHLLGRETKLESLSIFIPFFFSVLDFLLDQKGILWKTKKKNTPTFSGMFLKPSVFVHTHSTFLLFNNKNNISLEKKNMNS